MINNDMVCTNNKLVRFLYKYFSSKSNNNKTIAVPIIIIPIKPNIPCGPAGCNRL